MKEENIIPGSWEERKRQIKYRWATPFIWFEWLMEWVVYRLRSWSFIDFLELAGRFTVVIAVIFYLKDCDNRAKQKHYQAWQVMSLAQGKTGSGGRIQALQELNEDGVSLAGIDVAQAFLANINLQGADLQKADLREANLQEADLRGTDLQKANLRKANLQKANLQDANLIDANLIDANLQKAYFADANLRKANLQKADLWEADLWEADLSGAILVGAILVGADLWEANLQGANLRGADLRGTDLREAENITIEQLSKVKTLYQATLDPEIEQQIKEKYPHLLEKPKEE